MNKDEKWMQIALEEAKKAESEGEVPVGAAMVKNNLLIGKAHNQPISKNDPTAHAEIQLLRIAGKALQNYRLLDTTLYVTLEPCNMCFGAMRNARIKRLVFGAYDHKLGIISSTKERLSSNFIDNNIEINGGILEDKCSLILKKFFQQRR